MSEFPEIETANLSLRELSQKDVRAYLAIRSDYAVMEQTGLSIYAADDERRVERYVQRARRRFERGEFIAWGIFRRDLDALMGSIYERVNEQSGRIEIGYFLAQAAWGRGYMTEVLSAVARYNFEETPAGRQQAWVMEGNRSSERVLEKCGFSYEGTLRDYVLHPDGARRDVRMYGLIRPGPGSTPPA